MIRPTARITTLLTAVLAGPLATAADVSIYLSDQDDLTGSPTFSNAAVNKGVAESGSLFIYVDTSVPLLGVPLDIRSTTPGVIEFTGINFFNPYLDPSDGFAATDNFDLTAFSNSGAELNTVPDIRWASTSSDPVTPDSIDTALSFAFGFIPSFGFDFGQGLDPNLASGLVDPRTSAAGDYAFAEITYNTLAEGTTDIFVSISSQNDLALTPFGDTPENTSVTFGAGEATELTGITGAGQPLVNGTPVAGNLIADAVITATESAISIDGDYDGNGFVSQSDLDLVLLNWGSSVIPAEWVAVDQFDNIQVSQNELDGVLLNWGDGTPPVVTIPEPTSFALLGLGGLLTIRRRG